MVRSPEIQPCKDKILQSASVKGNDISDKKKMFYIGGYFFCFLIK